MGQGFILSPHGCGTGLPDGIISNQKSKFGLILEGLGIETVGIFCGLFEYIMAIWYMFWPFGIFFWSIGIFSGPLVMWR
jgi:hypothetical protein